MQHYHNMSIAGSFPSTPTQDMLDLVKGIRRKLVALTAVRNSDTYEVSQNVIVLIATTTSTSLISVAAIEQQSRSLDTDSLWILLLVMIVDRCGYWERG